MFEPKIRSHPLDTAGMTYHVHHSDHFIALDSSDIDPPHIHDCFEIYLNVAGDVSFLVNNQIYPITPGDMILTRPSELHHCIYHTGCVHTLFCLWMSEGKSGMLDFFRSSDVNFLSLEKEAKQHLIADFYSLQSAADTDPLSATATLLRILSTVKNNMHTSAHPEKNGIPAEMQAIIDYINTNYSTIPSIHVLPEQFFISPSTIHRWFDRYLHVSPKAYLESVKLSNAKRLLERGESVTDACFAAGYSDCSHFISVFKRKFGETPLQYKKAVHDVSASEK